MLAQNFQEMFLKLVLDRTKFASEFVPLGKPDFSRSSSSTFYLLLPVNLDKEDKIAGIDWSTIRKCLSSPIFRAPGDSTHRKIHSSDIRLASGYRSISDVENSLVYVPHKSTFYFITGVVRERNAYSPYEDSGTLSYVDHLVKK